MKSIWGLFWKKEYKLLKVFLMNTETDIMLVHHLMNSLSKQLTVLLLKPLHHCILNVFVQRKCVAL